MSVRVRYAPSPTGLPHVGNIRTALFNWLFARHEGGVFVVRIEDTDRERMVAGAEQAILDGLRWLGVDWDEGPEAGGRFGPYYQSHRLRSYHEVAERLVREGHAYLCYCTAEELEEMRRQQALRREPPRYDRRCRELTEEERRAREAEGRKPVVRFKTPLDGETAFEDLIRGRVVFSNATLDDFVMLKSDGFPTYHLANVVDDHLMEISHIMRGDEWLSSTPRHVLMYQALGWQPPKFAHMPMILGPDRSKLSKRHGATSITEYRDAGYLPEALMNFLSLLGWSLDDRTELLTREELIRYFSLERIGKTGAIFNKEKLDWMNGVYIRRLSPEDLLMRVLPFLERGLPAEVPRPLSHDYLRAIVELIQERLRTLAEGPELVDFFFLADVQPSLSYLVQKGMTREQAHGALASALGGLEQLERFDDASLEGLLRPMASELGFKTGQFFGMLRVAVTGRTAAPPLFATMAVLGRERCLYRIESARQRLAMESA